MLRLGATMVVCAVAGFVAAFFAAGAGDNSPARRAATRTQAAGFTDPAARGVAYSFAGRPGALKLPPPPRHVRQHQSRPIVRVVTVAAPPTTVSTPTTAPPTHTAPPVVSPPPPVHHKHSQGGSGTGTTTIG